MRTGNDDMSLSSHESDHNRTSVTFADLSQVQTNRQIHQTTVGDNSTAKSSTHYRLQRDKSRELAAKSQEESRQLLDALRNEREELAKAREELERLRLSANTKHLVTPSAKRDDNGAEPDSAVINHE